MRLRPPSATAASWALAAALAASVATTTVFVAQRPSDGYTIITRDGRHPIPSRTANNVDFLPLDQIASIFNLTVSENRAAGSITVMARGQRITLSVGQSMAIVDAQFKAMSGAVSREGATFGVPADFLSRVLGGVLGQRIEVRRGPKLVLVDLRLTQVTSRMDRQGANARLVVEFQPPTPHQVTRDGNTLTVRFETDQLDSAPLVGAMPQFIASTQIDGPSLVFKLGPLAGDVHPAEENDRIVVDLVPPSAAGTVPARPSQPLEASAIDLGGTPGIRVVVLDPGHGGEDEGVRGSGGGVEKDLTLQVARRLKSALESRGGIRVLLTRENDDGVSIERRTALANNNKADIFISLHANAAMRADLRGAQVLSLDAGGYKRSGQSSAGGVRVPVVGGTWRVIDLVPWELAQLPFAGRSATFAGIVARQLGDHSVTMYAKPSDAAPLGILVGANMPAVLVEMGFLTNPDDERALVGGDGAGAIVDAIVAAIGEVRNGIPEGSPVR